MLVSIHLASLSMLALFSMHTGTSTGAAIHSWSQTVRNKKVLGLQPRNFTDPVYRLRA